MRAAGLTTTRNIYIMFITRTSILTNKIYTYDLDVTRKQLDAWGSGTLLQDAFPNLWERDFIKLGIGKDEWDKYFKG